MSFKKTEGDLDFLLKTLFSYMLHSLQLDGHESIGSSKHNNVFKFAEA